MTDGLNHRDFALQAFDKWLETNSFPPTDVFLDGDKTTQWPVVLDVGARDTKLKAALEQRGFRWFGVDPFPLEGGLLMAKMEDLFCVPSEKVDLIFCCHAFEHCEKPIDALREFKRVLKPGGKVFIATPFPCEHHILKADTDHIMVLMPMQMCRLLTYTGFFGIASQVWPGDIEQNNTVVTTGVRE